MENTKQSTSITEAGLVPIRIRIETVARTHLAKKKCKNERHAYYTTIFPWHRPLTAFTFTPGYCPIQATLDMEHTILNWKPDITGFPDGSVKKTEQQVLALPGQTQ